MVLMRADAHFCDEGLKAVSRAKVFEKARVYRVGLEAYLITAFKNQCLPKNSSHGPVQRALLPQGIKR